MSRQARKRLAGSALIILALASYCLLGFAFGITPSAEHNNTDPGKLSLTFEPNVGQVGGPVRYLAHAPGANLFFTPSEVVLALSAHDNSLARANNSRRTPGLAAPEAEVTYSGNIVRLRFLGANPTPIIANGATAPGKVNYLIGNDPTAWHTDVPLYGDITYRDLYSGIDLIYSGEQGRLKGTYWVASGADPTAIRWRYEGADAPTIDGKGNLIITPNSVFGTQHSVLTEATPVAWQEIDGSKMSVDVRYDVRADGSVGFHVASYDPARPLVIDPTLTYSTYLGGSSGESAYGIAVDGAHNMYIIGGTGSTDYPVHDPIQPNPASTSDMVITKLNPEGNALVYSTYLGGNGIDWAKSVAVDGAGNVVAAGHTDSTNFPTVNPKQPTIAGWYDAFVFKLNAQGSALIFSTYLGGITSDMAWGVAVDPLSNVYVTGDTHSANFPTFNAVQGTLAGSSDVFITKYTPDGQAFVYSTYLGGDGGFSEEVAYGIAADNEGNAYVTGDTVSQDFPVFNAMFPTYQGGESDIFITKLNPTGSAFIYSTYFGGGMIGGGSGADTGFAIDADGAGNAYITGNTDSTDFPTRNPIQPTLHGFYDAFITKLNPTGSDIVYSTYLGGEIGPGNEGGEGIEVNSSGEVAVVGLTASNDFPLVSPVQPNYGGQIDAFAVKLVPSGTQATFVTYLGGSNSDYGQDAAIDDDGSVYATGWTAATNFPLANPFQDHLSGVSDIFISKITEGSGGTPTPGPSATATSTRTATATPSATPTCCSDVTGSISAACQPSPYSVSYTITNNCPITLTANIASAFEVSPNAAGPWRVVYVGDCFSCPVPPGTSQHQTTVYSGPLPAGNNFWRYHLGYSGTTCTWSLNLTSDPQPACVTATGTATPSPITQTRTPTNTALSATATATTAQQTPTTSPPSSTPTSCSIQFTDVPNTHTFYTYIRCLACRDIIDGYTSGCETGDPCFRPGNLVTRGQLAKIVSNSAGFSEPASGQQFQDVPPGSTFFEFVWRLADRGYINGYPCGGPGEPCGTGNLPYFRPNTNITRGQISKIVSNAAGLTQPATTQQFQDVPPEHTFYVYIWRLANIGIMQGYPCGGPGEPCGTGNLPYFRPGNNATRGQASKIVANTFFPECNPTGRR